MSKKRKHHLDNKLLFIVESGSHGGSSVDSGGHGGSGDLIQVAMADQGT